MGSLWLIRRTHHIRPNPTTECHISNAKLKFATQYDFSNGKMAKLMCFQISEKGQLQLRKFFLILFVLVITFYVSNPSFWGLFIASALYYFKVEEVPWIKPLVEIHGKQRRPFNVLMVLVFLFVPLSYFISSPFSNDNVSLFKKALYRLDYLSSYTSIDGIRLHNECWNELKTAKEFDTASLQDADGDGFSTFCESADSNYLLSPKSVLPFSLHKPNAGHLFIGEPIVWSNVQANAFQSETQNYEVVFTGIGAEGIEEFLSGCSDSIDRMSNLYLCNVSSEAIVWLQTHKDSPINLTIKAIDRLRKRQVLVQNYPLLLKDE